MEGSSSWSHLHCAFVFARSSGWQRLKKKQAFSSQSLNDLFISKEPAGLPMVDVANYSWPWNWCVSQWTWPQNTPNNALNHCIRNHPQSSAIIRTVAAHAHPHTPTHQQNIDSISLYEFTGSGWGLWFSSRKCRLYKLGTQENPATNIKPIWGILEKWQRTRSAFSKLCLAFFLRKTPPYLNCIVLKLRNQIC